VIQIRIGQDNSVKGNVPVRHTRGRVVRMQENQIKVGDLVICKDTLFVTREEQLPGIVLDVWDEQDDDDEWIEVCTVQHPELRSRWWTGCLKVLVRA
jgi:hypothetical protein